MSAKAKPRQFEVTILLDADLYGWACGQAVALGVDLSLVVAEALRRRRVRGELLLHAQEVWWRRSAS